MIKMRMSSDDGTGLDQVKGCVSTQPCFTLHDVLVFIIFSAAKSIFSHPFCNTKDKYCGDIRVAGLDVGISCALRNRLFVRLAILASAGRSISSNDEALESVITSSSKSFIESERVGVEPANKVIVACPTVERVVLLAPVERVVSGSAGHPVPPLSLPSGESSPELPKGVSSQVALTMLSFSRLPVMGWIHCHHQRIVAQMAGVGLGGSAASHAVIDPTQWYRGYSLFAAERLPKRGVARHIVDPQIVNAVGDQFARQR